MAVTTPIEGVKIVQVTTEQATPNALQKRGILKSIVLQNTGADVDVQVWENIAGPTDYKRLDLKMDASVQGYLLQVPLWDLYFANGLLVDVGNGSAFFIYEEVDKPQGSTIVQLTADGQAIAGDPGILKGMIVQGSGSDTQVRLWDERSAAEHDSKRQRLIDVKIDATYHGFCVPVPLFDLEFNHGVYGDVDNGNVFLIYQQ